MRTIVKSLLIESAVKKRYNHSVMKLIELLVFTLPMISLHSQSSSESAIHALYHSISESDISKLLAFYQLYPNTIYGTQALHSAWENLQKHRSEKITITSGIDLPQIDIDMMIQFLSQTSTVTGSLLDNNQIELLERISDHLSNRKLKGHEVWNKDELNRLNAEEIDLSRAILLHELDDIHTIRQYEVFLDCMALQILATLPLSATPIDKIHALNHWIFYKRQFRFPPHSLWPKDIDSYTLLAPVIDNKQGVCLGISILYICLAQRLGVSLQIFTPPGHIYLSYTSDNQTINIETTARGRNVSTREYLSSNVRLLPRRSLLEVLGMVFINRGSKFLRLEDYRKALKFYEKAIVYLPDDPLVKELLGFTLLLTKTREKEAIDLLSSVSNNFNPTLIYQGSLAKDYLENRINLEGIKTLWLPVMDDRESILEKNHRLQKLIEEFPITREGLFHLAISYLQLSNTVEAEKVLLKYISIEQGHPTVHYYLSMLGKKHMNLPSAWKHYRIASSIIEASRGNLYCLQNLYKQLQSLLPESAIVSIKNIERKGQKIGCREFERVLEEIPLEGKAAH